MYFVFCITGDVMNNLSLIIIITTTKMLAHTLDKFYKILSRRVDGK